MARFLTVKALAKLEAAITAKCRERAEALEIFHGSDNPQILEMYHRAKGEHAALTSVLELIRGDVLGKMYFAVVAHDL